MCLVMGGQRRAREQVADVRETHLPVAAAVRNDGEAVKAGRRRRIEWRAIVPPSRYECVLEVRVGVGTPLRPHPRLDGELVWIQLVVGWNDDVSTLEEPTCDGRVR